MAVSDVYYIVGTCGIIITTACTVYNLSKNSKRKKNPIKTKKGS